MAIHSASTCEHCRVAEEPFRCERCGFECHNWKHIHASGDDDAKCRRHCHGDCKPGANKGYWAMERVLITGNTYPVRDELRALGGRWSASENGWLVPANVADKARALVGATPPKRTGYRTASGLCTKCGDDCGGTNWRCGYE